MKRADVEEPQDRINALTFKRSDAARVILGMAITYGGDTLKTILDGVKVDDFPEPHADVYRAIRHTAKKPGASTENGIDPGLVRAELIDMDKPELGNGFLGSLISDSYVGMGVEPYIDVLIDSTAELRALESDLDADVTDEKADEKMRLTDAGNAARLIRRHGGDLRWSVADGAWLVWNGQRWELDDHGEVQRRCLDTVKAIYTEALSRNSDEMRRTMIDFARASESAGRLNAMHSSAWYLPGVQVKADELDADKWLLNCRNGALNLKTGKLTSHRRQDYCTRMVAANYDPEAKAPTFEVFIKKITNERSRLITYLQRILGSALSGDVSEQKAYLLVGVGANGKSTLINVMYDLLDGYAKAAPTDALLSKRRDDHPTAIAGLRGARFVAARENDEGRRLAEGLLKELTGGDRIAGRKMYENYSEFTPTFKLFLALNHAPTVSDNTHSMWRRLKVVPFDVVIQEPEQDKTLPEKLRAELPGILAWLVQGCLDWQKNGLEEPQEVTEATSKYRHEQDTVRAFFDECCKTVDQNFATIGEVYAAFKQWSEEGGEKKPLGRTTFNKRLRGHGFKDVRRNYGQVWEGLAVLDAYKVAPESKGEEVKS